MTEKLEELYQAVLEGDRDTAVSGVQAALDAGTPASDILTNGLIAPMSEIGRLFEDGEAFVPEMLIAARAMKGGLEILRPHLVEEDIQPVGKVVIGTVKGDLHDIGKNLVAMMLEGAGFEVIDLGVDVDPEEFVEAARKHKPNIIAMSALLTTTMPSMQQTVAILRDAGVLEDGKIIVGGAPVTQEYATEINADGFAVDASRAATLAKSYLE